MKQGNNLIVTNLYGNVLEVGAGDTSKKNVLCKQQSTIKKYTVTDYSSWDREFSKIGKQISRFGKIAEILFGFKKRGSLDVVCDATNLPFKNNTFDFHLSFEVLEHISDPFLFIKEAARVVKKGGHIILTVPVLFRIHGIEPRHLSDYFRYMPGFFHEIAKRNELKINLLYSNTGIGTTVAEMINQWFILQIREGFFIKKMFLFFLAIFIFPITNIGGFIIDIHPDNRFCTRYHIILEK